MKILINNSEFNHFSSYTINLKYNTIASTFSFSGLKDFIPNLFSFPEVKIYDDNDNLLITGRIVIPTLSTSSKPELSSIEGYSLPGILEHSNIPVSLYPLQSDNLSLKQIVERLIKPFNLKFEFESTILSDANKKYEKSIAEATQSIKDYINSLSSQRNIILTHTADGKIKFTRLNLKSLVPKYKFDQNEVGIDSMALNIDSQSMHSEITVIKQATKNNPDSGEYTIKNPYISIFKPKVKVLDSGDIFDVKKAARMELSNELSSIQLSINTKQFVSPGNLIQVIAPDLKINKITDFFVVETIITGDQKNEKYTLNCVLPDIFSDNDVKNIFQ